MNAFDHLSTDEGIWQGKEVALDNTEQDKSECGLSRMLDILYSKFCAATVLSSTRSRIKHHYEAVQ